MEYSFANRHIGTTASEKAEMLSQMGHSNMESLISDIIPNNLRMQKSLDIPTAMNEFEYLNHINKMAAKNKVYKSYIGMGYHPCYLPAVIQRNILENPGWYTAYTPYQAEISQGRLEALLNFQTMVSDLTGLAIANASLLDEGTAAAEAMSILFEVRSREQKKNGVNKFLVSEDIFPQTYAILKTRALPKGIELVSCNLKNVDFESDTYFGALIQYQGKSGQIYPLDTLIPQLNVNGIKTAIGADILSLALLEAPGHLGADIVFGTTQRFGIPMGYGGPHAAFFATKEDYKRLIPGRIIGLTKDKDNQPALRMALQTREQHIKRDRATSNICTAQVLLAIMASMYAVYYGSKGIKGIAHKVHNHTRLLASLLQKMGYQIQNDSYFDTLHVICENKEIKERAENAGINFNYVNKGEILISINETTTLSDIEEIVNVFNGEKQFNEVTPLENGYQFATQLIRKSEFLTDTVFNTYHSETELMRYIKRLERKDLALNHSMISLGSCTMKLNAAAQMIPISNPQWGNIHPYAPKNQVEGYDQVLHDLEKYLAEISGLEATSLQPNSGAQGEFAGLMVIKAFHNAQGNSNRTICLIPASAHGTNPASAIMAGMKVVVVKSTEDGSIDIDDLREKSEKHSDTLAALMVTYPSTHGVYESGIKKITDIIHQHGGQVYLDGANLNAQVGYTNPGIIGADVCHLNLHKTFAIPHGGGGPGVGPICVAKHLIPFLPSKNNDKETKDSQALTISSAPYGSALVCLISYGYIKLLGTQGLKESTEIALLNANYMKNRLEQHFSVLYTGEKNCVAHEMIMDCRPFKQSGVDVIDIAKRLMDYGFHAPTVSFPVAGTLMIEPTESENKAELDRFCDALIAIKDEILAIEDTENNTVKNAPHTLDMLTQNQWEFPYSRQQAAYPLSFVKDNKFWPSVRRVDDTYGDRNLICTCTPIEVFMEN